MAEAVAASLRTADESGRTHSVHTRSRTSGSASPCHREALAGASTQGGDPGSIGRAIALRALEVHLASGEGV